MSLVDKIFGALGGEMNEASPDVPSEVCLYTWELLTPANDHEILKGTSFNVQPDANALCQRMDSEVNGHVLPGAGHATAMEAIKGEFGLRASATTAPGLPRVIFVAINFGRCECNRGRSGWALPQGGS